ncbi:SAM-dependent methyltransferase [Nocardiopsis exhalans]|uniref:SAM-dependent methyltransferase n=1 Tax=Nocardiopsis exhalans TaxID=163604 RepID=A0ABY5D4L1_9ACTN|nr:SAM-dependent methyltransferase [Nocardiopsis exhalans]USY18043.1 SAM-dependent methyltransferase [Nocardiopsis exhalans]
MTTSTDLPTCTIADLQSALLGANASPEARAHARRLHQVAPRMWELAQAGRDWAGSLLHQLRPWDMEQVVDLGCGMPRRTPSSGPAAVDTHEYAAAAGVRRCAYVDVDPDVVRARQNLARSTDGAVMADITDPEHLRHQLATCGIAPHRPTLVLLGEVLACMDDAQVVHVLGLVDNHFTAGFIALSHLSGLGPAPAALTRATGHRVRARSAEELLALLDQAGLAPYQGPTPVAAWPLPSCPTPGTDLLGTLARTGGKP